MERRESECLELKEIKTCYARMSANQERTRTHKDEVEFLQYVFGRIQLQRRMLVVIEQFHGEMIMHSQENAIEEGKEEIEI